MEFITSYELWRGNGNAIMEWLPKGESWNTNLGAEGFFAQFQSYYRLSMNTILSYFCTYKRRKQENVALLRLALLMVKSWFWPLSWLEQESFKNPFQTFSNQFFFCLLSSWDLVFYLPFTTQKNLKMENLPMAYENSLPSDILYHLETQIFLFCLFWGSLETSYSAHERWRRTAAFQVSLFPTPTCHRVMASEDAASKDTPNNVYLWRGSRHPSLMCQARASF